MKIRLFVALFFVSSFASNIALAATSKLCISAKGAVVARVKCKSGETIFDLNSLPNFLQTTLNAPQGIVGPVGDAGAVGFIGRRGSTGLTGPASKVAGPRGVMDFSACHRIVSGPVSSAAQVSLTANCDSVNEFLFEDEWSISGGHAFVQNNAKNLSLGSNNEKIPYGIGITANTATGETFDLTVKALCCPR